MKKRAGTVPDESCSGVSSFEVSSFWLPELSGRRLEHAKHRAARSSVLCLLSSVLCLLSSVLCPRNLETRNQKLETRNQKLETRNTNPETSKPETRNQKPRNPKPETRNQKLSNLQTLALSPCLGRVEMLKFSRLRKLTENGLRCNFHKWLIWRAKSKLEKFLKFFNDRLEYSAPRGLL